MVFPADLASNGSLLIAANNVSSTLNGGVDAAATSFTLASTVNFPSAGGVTVESEAIIYTANDTASAVLSGITRGVDSTTAAIHADGTPIYMHVQARHHNALKDEVVAIEANIADRLGQTATGLIVPGPVTINSTTTLNGPSTFNTTTTMNGPVTVNSTTTFNGPITINTTTTWNTATSLKGFADGSTAAAGYVGEFIESNTFTAQNFGATTVYTDIASFTLTAGEWHLALAVDAIQNGATWSRIDIGISTTQGNTTTGMNVPLNLRNFLFSSSSSDPQFVPLSIPRYRVVETATTIYYAKVRANYSAGTPQYVVAFNADRKR